MKILKIVIIIIAIIGVGCIICPISPQSNAASILKHAVNSSKTATFTATLQDIGSFSTDKPGSIHKIKCVKGVFISKKTYQNSGILPLTMKSTPLVEGEDVVANRKCWVVRLKAPSKKDPWKQIWVDKKSYVVLAYRDWQGKTVTSSKKMKQISFN